MPAGHLSSRTELLELLPHHVSNLLSLNLDHRGAHQTEVGAPRDPQMLSCRWRRGNFPARLGELKKQPGGAFSLRASLGPHLDPAVHRIGFIFSISQMRTLGHREVEQWAWPARPESGWLGWTPRVCSACALSRGVLSEMTPLTSRVAAMKVKATLWAFSFAHTSLKPPTSTAWSLLPSGWEPLRSALGNSLSCPPSATTLSLPPGGLKSFQVSSFCPIPPGCHALSRQGLRKLLL